MLPPLPYAMGIIPSFCVNGQKTLVMKEKVWAVAQDSFHIRDESNVELLQCKAKVFSLHHQKVFHDMQGNELWSLKHKPLSIPQQYYGERPDGSEAFHVQGHWHCWFPISLPSLPFDSLIKALSALHTLVVLSIAPSLANTRIIVGGARMTISFTNTASNNEPVELQLSGNWVDRYASLTWNDRPVAQITRDFLNARQILGDADTVCFHLLVLAGVPC